jgi:hypothetical protein
LVTLRLRPRFLWLGWLAVGLRTVAVAATFLSGPNLNFTELTEIDHVMFLGAPVALAGEGVTNPWMLTGQAALLSMMRFIG